MVFNLSILQNFFFTEINMSDDEREIDNDLDSEVNKFLLRRFFLQFILKQNVGIKQVYID